MKRPSRITDSSSMCGGASSGCQHGPSLRDKSIKLLRLQPYLLIGVTLIFCSCATRPKTYAPPDAGKLKASTQRVSKAVDSAHQHAREAQGRVHEAVDLAKEVQKGVASVKDVPPELVAKVNDLETRLNDAQQAQAALEKDLVEADQAKAQVEKDKSDYFAQAQNLANSATAERDERIKDETKLHWYRIHWWGTWIVFGLGVLACVLLAVLKFAGKLPFL